MKEDGYRLERIHSIGKQLLGVVEQKPITRDMVLNDFEKSGPWSQELTGCFELCAL